MTPPPSDYIKALYQVVNTARDERGYQAAITELQKIEGGNLFEFCVTNQNLPHESRYVRINPKALPAIVGSIYFLLRDPIYKPQNVNISFRGHIDTQTLEMHLEDQLPQITAHTAPRSREYQVEEKPILKIISGSSGIRRCVFYPITQNQLVEAHPQALQLIDLIFTEECFYATSSGPISQGMVPTLSLRGELKLVQRTELRQEVRRIAGFRGKRAILETSRGGLRAIVTRARRQ